MMWTKREQVLMWITAYIPLLIVMFSGFIYHNDLLPAGLTKDKLEDMFTRWWIVELVFLVTVLILSLGLYRLVIWWLLRGLEERLAARTIGREVSIRQYEKISVNDYTFFLLTLLLPQIVVDYSSVVNLTVSMFIIIFIITVYVKTDSIATCPLFFVSGRQVYQGVISNRSRDEEEANPDVRLKAVLIVREKDMNLDIKYRAQVLVSNVYMIRPVDKGEQEDV
ncbi:hypothetical protein [Paenibacillus bovis]|nr:hypothetical protein [Paenibacillus bovis]